ncbi:MAG: SsrA-binding protein [Flavobacteriaceae bacterium]|jgi:hypothetical protein|nr:SsrA-binding protein [Flavobacteriaceae bacterium]
MKKNIFKFLAKFNKLILPSLTKRNIDVSKASKAQLILLAWRAFVTKRSL